MLEGFCRAHAIPFELCGKVIVATEEKELPSMQKIYERGVANGVQCRRIDDKELHEIEPHARGVAAIHVPRLGLSTTRRLPEAGRAVGKARRSSRIVGRGSGDRAKKRTISDRNDFRFI